MGMNAEYVMDQYPKHLEKIKNRPRRKVAMVNQDFEDAVVDMQNNKIAKAVKEVAIENAKKILRDNGYLIKKPTKMQLEDCKRCEEMSERGEDMECIECSCSCCLMQ